MVPAYGNVVTTEAVEWSRDYAYSGNAELLFLWALWILVVLALARPQILEPPVIRVLPTRDLMLLVDLSGSMETRDFTNLQGDKVDRLTAVKEVLDDFPDASRR